MGQCCCDNGVNEEKWSKLDEIISEHKDRPGSLIPVLHKAQVLFGYLPKEVQIKVAEGLNVPLSEVYGVVTFYSLFSLKPRGKYNIGVCMGTACYVKGANEVLDAIKAELGIAPGDTTDDGQFSLEITRCMGACGLAPVIAIGDDIYGKLTKDKIPDIIRKYRQQTA